MDQTRKDEIEAYARDLQKKLWYSLAEKERPKSVEGLIALFNPESAARFLGINVQVMESLGRFGDHREKYEVAAVLNRTRNLIAVSEAERFSSRTIRFTMAHELGHWLLHSEKLVHHRDRPIEGIKISHRAPLEAEADYFAGCFLMPRGLLKMAFERCFGKAPLILNDHTAFSLAVGNPGFMLRAEYGSLERQQAVARATHFNGIHFDSLADQFRVSLTSMAIQLREFNLVPDWP